MKTKDIWININQQKFHIENTIICNLLGWSLLSKKRKIIIASHGHQLDTSHRSIKSQITNKMPWSLTITTSFIDILAMRRSLQYRRKLSHWILLLRKNSKKHWLPQKWTLKAIPTSQLKAIEEAISKRWIKSSVKRSISSEKNTISKEPNSLKNISWQTKRFPSACKEKHALEPMATRR